MRVFQEQLAEVAVCSLSSQRCWLQCVSQELNFGCDVGHSLLDLSVLLLQLLGVSWGPWLCLVFLPGLPARCIRDTGKWPSSANLFEEGLCDPYLLSATCVARSSILPFIAVWRL